MMETVIENTRQSFQLEKTEDGLAFLGFDLPGEKVNKLTSDALRELREVLKEIAVDSSIKAVVFQSSKDSNTFIAGADINEIFQITDPTEATRKAREAQEILDQLAKLPQPVIAVVHGACLGGGTELILACDFRIATDDRKTKIGLPEVQLGIIPGFGGTQRLPRLIGIRPALGMILTGKTVDARKAAKLGLVDHVAPVSLLRQHVSQFARRVIDQGGKKFQVRRRRRSVVDRILERSGPLGRKLIGRLAAKNLKKRVGDHYPAPYRALEAVLGGYPEPLASGLGREAEIVGKLAVSSVCKNLIAIFLDSEKVRRSQDDTAVKGAPESGPHCPWDKPVRRLGVLGAGTMGGGIAALLARKGFHVRLKDVHPDALSSGLREADKSFRKLVQRRRLTPFERDNVLAAISATTELTGFRHVELVIEAVVEDMEIKKSVLREIEAIISKDALFASNTSSLSIDELAQAAQFPERVVGLHFFNPVHRMPLVEIIYGEKTSEETLQKTEALAREIGKYPVRVKNGPGFLVNRLLMPYLNEAAHLFEEGFDLEAIDRKAVSFGLPMGPFALLDEVGLDVANKVAKVLHGTLGGRAAPADLLAELVDKKKLVGKKGGAGFYLYNRQGNRRRPNPKLRQARKTQPDVPELWIRRMLYPMVNEAALCLEESMVESAWQVDLAMVMGTGFPPFLGGPLRWADNLGVKSIVDSLEQLRTNYSAQRFEPADSLKKLAEGGKGFYTT